MTHLFCATRDANLPARLQQNFKVLTSQDPTYEALAARLGMANSGALEVPDAVIVATNLSLNHSRETALATARKVRTYPALAHTRVVVVDMNQRAGAGDVYIEERVEPAPAMPRMRELLAQGGIAVVPNSPALVEMLGNMLGLTTKVAGHLIAVAGTKGGAGRTTVASALATGLHHVRPSASVLVVDFDRNSSQRFISGVPDNAADLKSLTQHVGSLSDETLLAHVHTNSAGVGILPGPAQLGFMAVEIREWLDLLDSLRTRFDYVIVDMDANVTPRNKEILSVASHIVVVVRPRYLDALVAGTWTCQFIRSLGGYADLEHFRAHVLVVVNDYERDAGPEARVREQVEHALQATVLGILPRSADIPEAQAGHTYFPTGRRSPAWQKAEELTRALLSYMDRGNGNG